MFGELLQGMPQEGQPSLEEQWSQVLKKPEIAAGLLNFGVEMMKPRWSAGSALPDAISAGARGYGGVQEEQYRRQHEQEAIDRSTYEKEADRQNRVATTQIAADSRAEVANARSEAMLQGIQLRADLKTPPKDQQEQKIYSRALEDARKEFKSSNDAAFVTGEGRISDTEIEQRAAQRAQDALMRHRLAFGRGESAAPADAAPNTSANSPSSPPAVGQVGAKPEAKNTSTNTQNTANAPAAKPAAPKPTFEQMKATLQSMGRWTPAMETNPPEQIKNLISDPQTVDRLRMKNKPYPPGVTPESLQTLDELAGKRF